MRRWRINKLFSNHKKNQTNSYYCKIAVITAKLQQCLGDYACHIVYRNYRAVRQQCLGDYACHAVYRYYRAVRQQSSVFIFLTSTNGDGITLDDREGTRVETALCLVGNSTEEKCVLHYTNAPNF